MGTKSFVQIEINAVFTTASGKMQFRSGVFDHFKMNKTLYECFYIAHISTLKDAYGGGGTHPKV
jgi:hypothetical protein